MQTYKSSTFLKLSGPAHSIFGLAILNCEETMALQPGSIIYVTKSRLPDHWLVQARGKYSIHVVKMTLESHITQGFLEDVTT